MDEDTKDGFDFEFDASNASEDDVAEALALLGKKRERNAKIKAGLIKGSKPWADLTEEEKERSRMYNRKRQVKISLLAKKAVDAGYTVSEEEVDAAMKASK
jgi:hypothetical protein